MPLLYKSGRYTSKKLYKSHVRLIPIVLFIWLTTIGDFEGFIEDHDVTEIRAEAHMRASAAQFLATSSTTRWIRNNIDDRILVQFLCIQSATMAEVKQYTITEPWLDTQCKLGEAPFWDSASNTLRFLDIVKQELYTVDLSKGASSMTKTDTKVSMSTTANIKGNRDELIFAGKNGYGIMNKTTQTTRMLKQYWGDDEVSQRREQRLTSNDGLVDPAGRYIVGTMNDRQMFKEPMAEGQATHDCRDDSHTDVCQASW